MSGSHHRHRLDHRRPEGTRPDDRRQCSRRTPDRWRSQHGMANGTGPAGPEAPAEMPADHHHDRPRAGAPASPRRAERPQPDDGGRAEQAGPAAPEPGEVSAVLGGGEIGWGAGAPHRSIASLSGPNPSGPKTAKRARQRSAASGRRGALPRSLVELNRSAFPETVRDCTSPADLVPFGGGNGGASFLPE